MDEIIKALKARRLEGRLPTNCRAVIAHEEDASSGERVRELCRALEVELGAQSHFEFGCWDFGQLGDSQQLHAAAEQAADADLILFSFHAGIELPRPVQEWIEAGLARRSKRGGAVALLIGPAQVPGESGWSSDSYLRYLAERAEMEFWASTPCETSEPMPASVDVFMERAGEVTAVLENILKQESPRRV
ncbi:MAG: hypothetical protein JWR69_3108 [Pedosphaera sp.]|nr:hypothetical protein [Pedosphaera sp.]